MTSHKGIPQTRSGRRVFITKQPRKHKEGSWEICGAGAHHIANGGRFLIKIPLSFGPSEAPPQATFLMLHSKAFCRLRHR
jgi:hypothetical protein